MQRDHQSSHVVGGGGGGDERHIGTGTTKNTVYVQHESSLKNNPDEHIFVM
jgi:hypothetical protein